MITALVLIVRPPNKYSQNKSQYGGVNLLSLAKDITRLYAKNNSILSKVAIECLAVIAYRI